MRRAVEFPPIFGEDWSRSILRTAARSQPSSIAEACCCRCRAAAYGIACSQRAGDFGRPRARVQTASLVEASGVAGPVGLVSQPMRKRSERGLSPFSSGSDKVVVQDANRQFAAVGEHADPGRLPRSHRFVGRAFIDQGQVPPLSGGNAGALRNGLESSRPESDRHSEIRVRRRPGAVRCPCRKSVEAEFVA